MSKNAVPCPCFHCKGALVSRYMRRKHTGQLVSQISSAEESLHKQTFSFESIPNKKTRESVMMQKVIGCQFAQQQLLSSLHSYSIDKADEQYGDLQDANHLLPNVVRKAY